MLDLKDRELIDLLTQHTYPRVLALVEAVHRRALNEQGAVDQIIAVLGASPPPSSPSAPGLDSNDAEALGGVWLGPLTATAVALLRGVGQAARNGRFRVSASSIAEVCSEISRGDLQRKTGVHETDLGFLIAQMADVLVEVVRKHKAIGTTINRQAVRLEAASQDALARPD